MTEKGNDRQHWVQVFTKKSWQEFLDAGGQVTGFREHRWGLIQQLKRGDYLLCYLSGISCWVGILEVQSDPYLDLARIWSDELYPARADVKVLVALAARAVVPIRTLRDRLSIFQRKNWSVYLMTSPTRWNLKDSEVVIEAIRSANSVVDSEKEPER